MPTRQIEILTMAQGPQAEHSFSTSLVLKGKYREHAQEADSGARLGRKTPSSARERAIFPPGKDGEAADVGFIVDTAGCSHVEKGPLEAR